MDDSQIATNYLRACWVIKIRLMSLRRSLWGSHFSHIQFESCLLQMRKVCEGYAQLNLLASHIEFDDVPSKFGSFYEVSRIIKGLRKSQQKLPLSRVRIEFIESDSMPRCWYLHPDPITDDDEDRIISIWKQSGRFLHDKTAFHEWPAIGVSESVLSQNLQGIRTDHQWLWNLIWQHHIRFSKTNMFVVRFGDDGKTTRPILLKEEGHFEVTDFEFDPKYLADFDGVIDWTEYGD